MHNNNLLANPLYYQKEIVINFYAQKGASNENVFGTNFLNAI